MENNIKEQAGRLLAKASFKVKKYSPEILLATGIAAGIAGTVMACKETLKVDEVIKEHKETIDKINTCLTDDKYKDKCIDCGLCNYVCPSNINLRKMMSGKDEEEI